MAKNTQKQEKYSSQSMGDLLTRQITLLENLPLGVFLVGEDEHIVLVNQALENFFRTSQEEFLFKSYRKLFGGFVELSTTPEPTWRELLSAASEVHKGPCLDFSVERGQIKQWRLTFFSAPGTESRSEMWGGFLQDRTDTQKQTSSQMAIVQTLAQNIRSPLASLRGHSAALVVNHHQWENELVAEFLGIIDREVNALVNRVDQSLALLRLERGTLNLRPESVDISDLIQGVVEKIGQSEPHTPIEFNLSIEIPPVRIDSTRVKEVLGFLLQGIIQENPKKGMVEISIRGEGNWAQVSVQSPGLVLGEGEQEIFVKESTFFSSDVTHTSLNLYASRKIIEAHGGRMWLESPLPTLGEGTKFSFTLPFAPQQSVARMSSKRIGVSPKAEKRILVVDNSSDTQILLRSILRKEGYTVELAPDGGSALDIIQTSPPDLVLMDWYLPDMGGLSVCRSIRRWAETPIMMVTSRTSPDDLVSAFRAGVDDYLKRPFLSDELLARVEALLRRHPGEQAPSDDDVFNKAGLRINFDTHEVWVRGEYIELTPIEYRLLAYMARHPRLVVSYDRLIGEIWDSPGGGSRRGLFAHVSRLRKKIESDPEEPEFLCTRWGVGYIFMPNR
ncbi:MAG: Transcriptional regulatory protein WalR [Chloroflexi bacterium]|nr:Transcriptional regulatory protein WalR [Chloroflexota bacterium]